MLLQMGLWLVSKNQLYMCWYKQLHRGAYNIFPEIYHLFPESYMYIRVRRQSYDWRKRGYCDRPILYRLLLTFLTDTRDSLNTTLTTTALTTTATSTSKAPLELLSARYYLSEYEESTIAEETRELNLEWLCRKEQLVRQRAEVTVSILETAIDEDVLTMREVREVENNTSLSRQT